jgi:hypothetical protein
MSESPVSISTTDSILLSDRKGFKMMAAATGSNRRKKGVLPISSFIFRAGGTDCNFAFQKKKGRIASSD